jgi:hypothetical protein
MLTALINAWRDGFCDKNLPVIVVQIADCDSRATEAWRTVQQAQMAVQDVLPNVRTVISRDVCESDDIHPGTKELLAKRIAAML